MLCDARGTGWLRGSWGLSCKVCPQLKRPRQNLTSAATHSADKKPKIVPADAPASAGAERTQMFRLRISGIVPAEHAQGA